MTILFICSTSNGDTELMHHETKETNKNDKILPNDNVIFNSRSHNIYHSLQANSRRDKSDKTSFSEYEQKYNKYRKSDTDNSYQNKNNKKNKSDSDDSEDAKIKYSFYHNEDVPLPSSSHSNDSHNSRTTNDSDSDRSIQSYHHSSTSKHSNKSSKKYSISSSSSSRKTYTPTIHGSIETHHHSSMSNNSSKSSKKYSKSSSSSSRITYKPTITSYPIGCYGKTCGSSKGGSKVSSYSGYSKKQSKKGYYPSHKPIWPPHTHSHHPTRIEYPTTHPTSLHATPTLTPNTTMQPIEPSSPAPVTPTPTACNDKGCPRPPRLDIPTVAPTEIPRPPAITEVPSNFPTICIGANCPPNSV